MLADRDVVNVPRSASERRRCRCPRGACVLRARAVRGAGGSRVRAAAGGRAVRSCDRPDHRGHLSSVDCRDVGGHGRVCVLRTLYFFDRL